MLINCQLFSHDRFVCTLISRGETFRNTMNDIKKPAHLLLARLKGAKAPSSFQKRQSIDCKSTTHLAAQASEPRSDRFVLCPKDHSSPMSVYQQPASMPAYHLPPHTPLQHQKSFSGAVATAPLPAAAVNPADPFYNAAPHSVPTPSKSLLLASSLQPQQQHEETEAPAKLPPPLTSATRPPSKPSAPRPPNAPPRLSVQPQQQRSLTKQTSMVHQPSPAAQKTPAAAKPAARPNAAVVKPMSKLAQYVLHIPVPQTQRFQHERNQRFVVLYGFGAKK